VTDPVTDGTTDTAVAAATGGGGAGDNGGGNQGLGRTAARGAAVTMTGQVARILLQVVSVVVLAKLLTPHDYGLVAMVMAIAGLADIFRDFGLSTAAVQARDLTREQRDNLFWLNSGLGAVLCAIIAAGGGLFANFYGEPDVAEIARLLAFTFLLNGIGTQYRADLSRRLRFRSLAFADIVGQLAGFGAGLGLALAGAGYWALVAQQLVQAATTLIYLGGAARWLPRRWSRDAGMGPLLRFGRNMVGMQVVGYVNGNLDSVVIGRVFGAATLGVYNRAFQLLMAPLTQIRAPTTTVALPVLSRLDDEPDKYASFVARGQVALGYSIVPALAIVAAAAEPVVALFLGDRWESVTPLLRILAFAGAVNLLAYVGYWVFLSRNLTGQLLRFTLVTFVARVVFIFVGIRWGVVGVAIGYAATPAISAPISLWWLSRMAPIPVRELIAGYVRILLMAVAAAGAGFGVVTWLGDVTPVLAIAAATLAVAGTYLLAAVLPPIRRDLADVLGTARLALRRERPR
jgi:O-antigen/teichoic acid export membrane protein